MPYYNRDPKRDHNFDNHPYEQKPRIAGVCSGGVALEGTAGEVTKVTLSPASSARASNVTVPTRVCLGSMVL